MNSTEPVGAEKLRSLTPTFESPSSGPRRKAMMARPIAATVASGTPSFDGPTLERRPSDLCVPIDLGRPTPILDALADDVARAELAEHRHRPWHTCQTALNALRGDFSGRFLPVRRGATGVWELPLHKAPGGPVDESELVSQVRRAATIAGYELLLLDGRGARLLLARNARVPGDAPDAIRDLGVLVLDLTRRLDEANGLVSAVSRLMEGSHIEQATLAPVYGAASREATDLRARLGLARAELLGAVEVAEGTDPATVAAAMAVEGQARANDLQIAKEQEVR